MAGYPIEGKVKAAGLDLPISPKTSRIICRRISGLPVGRAERFLQGLVDGTEDINGKHFTKTADFILQVLRSAKNNAETKGIEGDLRILVAVAEKGARRYRAKRRRSFGVEMKNTHIKVILDTSISPEAKAPKEEIKKEMEAALEEGIKETDIRVKEGKVELKEKEAVTESKTKKKKPAEKKVKKAPKKAKEAKKAKKTKGKK